MLAETVRGFEGYRVESDNGGNPIVKWVDSQFWALARDRNLAVVHLEVSDLSGGATVRVEAEDSSGRIFVPLVLTNNTTTTKGAIRVEIQNFAALLRLGVAVTGGSQVHAVVSLEYTLKHT